MKKVKLSTTIALILLAIATTVNVTLIISYDMLNQKQGDYQQMRDELSKIYEVMETVDELYVGEIDLDGALDGAAAGYVAGMGDKWSYYLSAEEYQEYIEDNNANLVGIGVSVVYSASEQAMLVTGVYDDSPASEAGIQKLDYIVSVDLQDVAEIGYTESLNLVSGEKGSMVEIEIVRDGINQFLTVQRDEVTKVSVTYEMIDDNIAYIKISHFETETANQFTELVNLALEEGAEAFVFDVRNNTGGYLTKLVECLDILLPEGNVISTVSKAGNEEVYTSDSEMLDMPITVLVNASSYSAAEFFAAAIQDYGVGTIVGQATTGKGYTQSPVQMSDGSAIILSTNKYYTPNGNNLADIGVIPDIEIELTDEQTANFFFLTSDTDPQIKAAVEQVTMELLK